MALQLLLTFGFGSASAGMVGSLCLADLAASGQRVPTADSGILLFPLTYVFPLRPTPLIHYLRTSVSYVLVLCFSVFLCKMGIIK